STARRACTRKTSGSWRRNSSRPRRTRSCGPTSSRRSRPCGSTLPASAASMSSNREEVQMESRAKLLGHPIHQMLIVFPLGLLATAVIFDVIGLFRGGDWGQMAYYMIAAGIIGGLVAAVFGLLD